MKADAKRAPIPILAVVDANQDRLAVKSLRAGADDFLMRPVNPELLYLKIQSYLVTKGGEQKECGVSGSLDEMNFTDLIQILCAGNRNADIILRPRRMKDGFIFAMETWRMPPSERMSERLRSTN